MIEKGDAPGGSVLLPATWQGNFELATNYDYVHLGQLTQAKSLRKCRISKLVLTAHKVLPEQKAEVRFWVVNWGED